MKRRALAKSICFVFLVAVLGLGTSSTTAQAAGDQSYDTLRHWIEHSRPGTELAPGQHLSLKDRAILEPLIPQSAWEYYFYDGMDMEITETGTYPPPEDWGQNVPSGYQIGRAGGC